MRFARKITLLAAMAFAALALSASTASATSNYTAVNEANNTTCTNLSTDYKTGGCPVHASGQNIELSFNCGFGFYCHEATCNVELELRVGGTDKKGAVDDQDLYNGDTNCDSPDPSVAPVTACNLPWKGTAEKFSSSPITLHAVSTVCLDSGEFDICGSSLEYDIVEGGSAGAESYTVQFVNSDIGICRINGSLAVEKLANGDSAIHVN